MKILAVDLSSIVRKFWEMSIDGKLSDNTPMRASVDYVTRARDGFDRVVLALDVGPSFRKLHCAEYKEKRRDPGEAYRKCYVDVVERLRKDGAAFFPNKAEQARVSRDEGRGVVYPEADDVIASLVAWWRSGVSEGAPVDPDVQGIRIVSGDTDLWALVDDRYGVEVCAHNQGDRIIHEADVIERFGGVGSWVTEVKALAGDKSDGYDPFQHHDPAMKGGIGEGKAVALLKKFGDDGNGEYSAAEVVARANLEDGNEYQMPDGHDRKCLRAARGGGLAVGYACARMLTELPLDFARILAEPKIEPIVVKPPTKPIKREERHEPAAMLATRPDQLDPLALQPQSIDEAFKLAHDVVNSKVFPHFVMPEQVLMVALEARERRVPFMTAARSAYIVKGRLAWSASFLAALVQRSSVCEVFEVSESTPEYAVVDYQRKGRPLRHFRYDIKEAETAGWVRKGQNGDSKWVTNPRVMLRWAALREAARAFFPDVVSGMYTPDELRDGRVLDAEFEATEADFEDQ